MKKEMHIDMDDEKLVCEVCGTDSGVTMAIDPYDYEIHGNNALRALCGSCIQSSADDI